MKKALLLIASILLTVLTVYSTLHIHTWLGMQPKYEFSLWNDFMMGVGSFPIGLTIDTQIIMTIPCFLGFMAAVLYYSYKEFASSNRSLTDFIMLAYRAAAFIMMISLVDYSFWSLGNAYVNHSPDWYRDFTHPDTTGHSTGLGWGMVLLNIAIFWIGFFLAGSKEFRKATWKSFLAVVFYEQEKEIA